jgi:hypothetical protein
MNTTDVTNVARYLMQTQGHQAIAEAAREADACKQNGDTEREKFWARVEAVLHEMRGPRQT